MDVTGLYQVLTTTDLSASRAFYEAAFGLRAAFVAEWYVQLVHPDRPLLQLGLVARGRPEMPGSDQRPTVATLVTLQVDDVDAAYHTLRSTGAPVLSEPTDEPWGQRHFLVVDPGGFHVDVVMPIAPAPEYAAAYAVR